MRKLLLGLLLMAVVWGGTNVPQPEPAHAADPVTGAAIAVGIGVGLAANLLTEVTKSVIGDTENARAQCDAETTGPKSHIIMGQDRAVHPGDYDTDKYWDSQLIASVKLEGPNHGKEKHSALAYINYHYVDDGSSKGWRPKVTPTSSDYVIPAAGGYARARPDGDPTPNVDNITAAAAVCAFGVHGKVSKDDTFSWNEENPKKKVKQSKTSNSKDSQAESQSSLYFSAERFSFDELPDGKVLVSPLGKVDNIELFHTSLMVGDKPTLLHQPFAGLGGSSQALASEILQDIADNSGGLAEYDPNNTKQADLTLTGAAVNLGSGEYDLFNANGLKKTRNELLMEYFADTSAVQIVAPAQAQQGYTPNVTCREVVIGTKKAACPNVSDELRDTIAPLSLENVQVDAPENTGVGIVVAAHGTLEDALTLAANTPGTEVENIVNSVPEGELFGLDFTYSQSDLNFAHSVANNRIDCPVYVFNPLTETFEDLCDDDTENVIHSGGTPVEDEIDDDHVIINGIEPIDNSTGTDFELIAPLNPVVDDGLIGGRTIPDFGSITIIDNPLVVEDTQPVYSTPSIDKTAITLNPITPIGDEGLDSPDEEPPLPLISGLIIN